MIRRVLVLAMVITSLLVIACSPAALPAAIPVASTVTPTPLKSGPVPSPTPPVKALGLPAAPISTFKVVNTYPHDRAAFTEGLVIDGGVLYESTGLNGQSSLRRVRLS